MSCDFDKIRTILVAEREDGCRDRVVIGGLDRFVTVWLRDARTAADTAADQCLVADVASRLSAYGDRAVAERIVAIQETLKCLAAGGREAAESVAPEAGRLAQEPESPPQRGPRRTERAAPEIKSSVTALRGVNSALARRLAILGIHTIEDLLYHFPRRHDDFSHLKTIDQLRYGEEVTIIGAVWEAKNQRTRKGGDLTRAAISDGTGTVEAIWFNQPYLVRQLARGRRIVLSGRVDQYLGRLCFESPEWEPWTDELVHTGRLVPVYRLTDGVTARRLRTLVKSAVEVWVPRLNESLPAPLLQSYGLTDLPSAIRQMHFPEDETSLARARYRLCFEELLVIQLGVLRQRLSWQGRPGRAMSVDPSLLDAFVNALPFSLTVAQQRVLGEIAHDVQQSQPMSRLLQGDVGSGKTVVALGAMLVTVANNMQAVMMAPTEILAEQHHATLTTLLQGAAGKLEAHNAQLACLVSEMRLGLLTGSLTPGEKERLRNDIAAGEVDIVVGTHALIQEGVSFKDLGLAIVDEQHRFGVAQRAALRQKGYNPHVLVMSATPIPRTLALTLYGDLDLSVINELPPQRLKIITRWLAPLERERAYTFVRDQVGKGRQAFIICPLIEDSDKIEAKAAVTEYGRLQDQVFPDLRLGLLHGRMKSAEKDEVMGRFRVGEYHVLVSTPVVEVGVDIPNATVMLVEGADRFGLAQLHQFRGRVGRGQFQSYCLLLAESPSFEGEQRLKVIETTDDGFLLAEEDLKMRGPGEFFGTRQSGLPDLKVAKLGDVQVLEKARQAAMELIQQDSTLSQPEHHILAQKVRDFWGAETDLS